MRRPLPARHDNSADRSLPKGCYPALCRATRGRGGRGGWEKDHVRRKHACHPQRSFTLEQRPDHRSEAPAFAQARLVCPRPAGNGGHLARSCAVQHGRRQQTQRLRSGLPQGARCLRRGPRQGRASVTQSKTRKPVRFEIAETTRLSLKRWIKDPEMIGCASLWPSRVHASPHLSTRPYARIMRGRVLSIGLEPSAYGTHSMRRTKVARINKKTGNQRAVQLLLGHTKMDSTVRFQGLIWMPRCPCRKAPICKACAVGPGRPGM